MVFGLKLGLPKKAPTEPPSGEPAQSGSNKTGSSGVKSALTVNEFVARTKRCREKGLEPTKPELIAYARYLGIDPIVDGDLMWIADEALNAPLPSEWTEHHDSADRVFYYNVQTHASSWTHPLEQLHRDTYKTIVNFRSGDTSKEERAAELERLRKKCEEAEREAHRELQAWSEHTDEQGQKFYYHREQQRSVWTDPRPARCHALYLQMKALRVLGKQMGQSLPAPRQGLEPLADSHRSNAASGHGGDGHRAKHHHSHHLLSTSDAEGADSGSGHDGPVMLDNDIGTSHKRNKRKKHKELEASQPSLSSPSGLDTPLSSGLLPPGDMKSPLLDMKKPPLSAVEEVRQAIGISGGTRLPPMGPHGGPFGTNRLPTPPGDGLSTVGRAKVRAGIRLEPLQGAAIG